jgi:hypothetical protein
MSKPSQQSLHSVALIALPLSPFRICRPTGLTNGTSAINPSTNRSRHLQDETSQEPCTATPINITLLFMLERVTLCHAGLLGPLQVSDVSVNAAHPYCTEYTLHVEFIER